jgi:hypothetical protein
VAADVIFSKDPLASELKILRYVPPAPIVYHGLSPTLQSNSMSDAPPSLQKELLIETRSQYLLRNLPYIASDEDYCNMPSGLVLGPCGELVLLLSQKALQY